MRWARVSIKFVYTDGLRQYGDSFWFNHGFGSGVFREIMSFDQTDPMGRSGRRCIRIHSHEELMSTIKDKSAHPDQKEGSEARRKLAAIKYGFFYQYLWNTL